LTRKLYLEKLNKPDIELFVKNQLQDRADFRALALASPDAAELASEIVQRSNGIFLWVYLVVLLVKQGLVNEDRLVDLKRRVSAYPVDLDSFFKHIMDSLDPIYQAQIARGFSVALAARKPLSVVSFWYLDELEQDASVAITKPVDDLSEKMKRMENFWTEEVRKMTVRLNGRFKGFLEIVVPHGSGAQHRVPSELKVDFLHRTVRDFLFTEDCQRVLKEWTPSDFDVHFALCNIQLAEAKELHLKLTEMECIIDLTDAIFHSARQFEICHQRSLNHVLEQLGSTLEVYGRGLSPWLDKQIAPWCKMEFKDFAVYAVMTNQTCFISNLFEANLISEKERLDYLQEIFMIAGKVYVEELHELPMVNVVGNPLEMILILVETRPLSGYIPFSTVLGGLEFYDTTTILGILRPLCKHGLVELEEFRDAAAQVRRLTTLWDAKELEEMTRTARKVIKLPLSEGQSKRTWRSHIRSPEKNISNKDKGKLHRLLERLKSG
jgi:hypothetical protein